MRCLFGTVSLGRETYKTLIPQYHFSHTHSSSAHPEAQMLPERDAFAVALCANEGTYALAGEKMRPAACTAERLVAAMMESCSSEGGVKDCAAARTAEGERWSRKEKMITGMRCDRRGKGAIMTRLAPFLGA